MQQIINEIKRTFVGYSKRYNITTNNLKEESFVVSNGKLKCTSNTDLEGEYTLSNVSVIKDYGVESGLYRDTFIFEKGVAPTLYFVAGKEFGFTAIPQKMDIRFFVNRDIMLAEIEKEDRKTTNKNRRLYLVAGPSERHRDEGSSEINKSYSMEVTNRINIVVDFPGRDKNGLITEELMLKYERKEKGLISILSSVITEKETGEMLAFHRTLNRSFVNNRYLIELGFSYKETIGYEQEILDKEFGYKAEVVKPKIKAKITENTQ